MYPRADSIISPWIAPSSTKIRQGMKRHLLQHLYRGLHIESRLVVSYRAEISEVHVWCVAVSQHQAGKYSNR